MDRRGPTTADALNCPGVTSEPLPSELRVHVNEVPLVRRGIFAAVHEFSRQLPTGTRILDAGAGNAPYARLFDHCEYVTADWGHSVHEGARRVDIVASLEDLPVSDGRFDAVLATEVLEHVENPEAVVSELHRVLVAGGRLCMTTPFVWPLHEEPYDFYRYTPHALRSILERTGFGDIVVSPTSGFFTTIAQMCELGLWSQRVESHGRLASMRLNVARGLWRAWSRPLRRLARRGRQLDDIFADVPLPLGYQAIARKPG